MTARLRTVLVVGFVVSSVAAAWGAHELLRAALEPLMRGLGS